MKHSSCFSLDEWIEALGRSYRENGPNNWATAPNGAAIGDVRWLRDVADTVRPERLIACIGDASVAPDGTCGSPTGNGLVVWRTEGSALSSPYVFICGWEGSRTHQWFKNAVARHKAIRTARSKVRKEHEFASSEMRNAVAEIRAKLAR